ncbi:MAG TPA: sn-glycerol-3-phosphate ABC transporter ATP-binding protein UgpC [Baekduia sp.]|nr:sn-glycerol-3-phosphate ABC transporter ATP-binding protein UgpC [Baekduia sp.]
MATITLQGLQKRYGDVEAVHALDLEIPDGEVTVLVGPSGCGKTTTLRLIAGLETASGGAITIGERDVTRLEPKDRDLAMVFQNYALYPHMSVRDNIAFGLKARKTSKAESDRRVAEAARLLSVDHLLARKPGALSGGQQQRVAIGRAIVREPAAFLFDEPLSNLDAKLRVEMRAEILRLQRRLDATIVHVTHDQEEAMTLAHRVVVMNGGRIEQIGTPAEVYRQPASEFVARFIGSPELNVLETARAHAVLGLNDPRGAARVGIRPEEIQLASAVPADEAVARFTARLDVMELVGAQAILTFVLPDEERVRALVDARTAGRLAEGQDVELAIAGDGLLRFDADGRRVP